MHFISVFSQFILFMLCLVCALGSLILPQYAYTLQFSFGFSLIKIKNLSSVIPNFNKKHWFCKILLPVLFCFSCFVPNKSSSKVNHS